MQDELTQKLPTSFQLNSKLKKYGIDTERYETEKTALMEKCYTSVQADNIILHPFSKNTVEQLLQYHDVLINVDYGFSHEQPSKIASKTANGKVFAALKINNHH